MKKRISVVVLASILVAGSAMASGWRIPEQSVDSTAKSGANIASSSRADDAYYNPANMAWLDDTWQVQVNTSWIHLTPIDYDDNRNPALNGSSEAENFIVPTGFMVSPDAAGFRLGLAITAPNGLAKRWKDPYPRSFAEKFALDVIEVNPTVSYNLGKVAIAAGPRLLYAQAEVKSDNRDALARGLFPPGTPPLVRDMDDETVEWGWNVALAVKPIDSLNLSATYRSNVDLEFRDKDARLIIGPVNQAFNATVSVPAPAVFALSAAYDVTSNINVELTWDRTFWSEYERLDFDFTPVIPGNPFETPLPKNWDDTDAIRLGLTWKVNDAWSLMGGLGWDDNPAPTETIGFELPDSDAWLFSLGTQYKLTDQLDLGLAALYDYKTSRSVVSADGRVNGEFTNASAFLLTAGLNYKF